jgi:hypothetical protein
MNALTSSRRPWAITVLAAGLTFWFVAFLVPLAADTLKHKGFLDLGNLGPADLKFSAHALAFLILNPLAAALILRRRPAGHWLALAWLGYLTILSAAFLLDVYDRTQYSTFAPFPHLTSEGQGVLVWATLVAVNGLLCYLALRPEVISYTHPARD